MKKLPLSPLILPQTDNRQTISGKISTGIADSEKVRRLVGDFRLKWDSEQGAEAFFADSMPICLVRVFADSPKESRSVVILLFAPSSSRSVASPQSVAPSMDRPSIALRSSIKLLRFVIDIGVSSNVLSHESV